MCATNALRHCKKKRGKGFGIKGKRDIDGKENQHLGGGGMGQRECCLPYETQLP